MTRKPPKDAGVQQPSPHRGPSSQASPIPVGFEEADELTHLDARVALGLPIEKPDSGGIRPRESDERLAPVEDVARMLETSAASARAQDLSPSKRPWIMRSRASDDPLAPMVVREATIALSIMLLLGLGFWVLSPRRPDYRQRYEVLRAESEAPALRKTEEREKARDVATSSNVAAHRRDVATVRADAPMPPMPPPSNASDARRGADETRPLPRWLRISRELSTQGALPRGIARDPPRAIETQSSTPLLSIFSTPTGARVDLDGETIGTTPLVRGADASFAGRTVRIVYADHAPWTGPLVADPKGHMTLNIRLEKNGESSR